jgi:hypothetical protein
MKEPIVYPCDICEELGDFKCKNRSEECPDFARMSMYGERSNRAYAENVLREFKDYLIKETHIVFKTDLPHVTESDIEYAYTEFIKIKELSDNKEGK